MAQTPASYPTDWRALSSFIRHIRAAEQCECMGECGLHRTHPGPRRCTERNGHKAQWARGRVVLTVAHLCHDTQCGDPTHLRAMCNRCHLRYDQALHQQHAQETRRRQQQEAEQRSGQGLLWGEHAHQVQEKPDGNLASD